MKNLPYVIFILIAHTFSHALIKCATSSKSYVPPRSRELETIEQTRERIKKERTIECIRKSTAIILKRAESEPNHHPCINLLNKGKKELENDFATNAVGNKEIIRALWLAFIDIDYLIAYREKHLQTDQHQAEREAKTTKPDECLTQSASVFEELAKIKDNFAAASKLLANNETEKAHRLQDQTLCDLTWIWNQTLDRSPQTKSEAIEICRALHVIDEIIAQHEKTIEQRAANIKYPKPSPI